MDILCNDSGFRSLCFKPAAMNRYNHLFWLLIMNRALAINAASHVWVFLRFDLATSKPNIEKWSARIDYLVNVMEHKTKKPLRLLAR